MVTVGPISEDEVIEYILRFNEFSKFYYNEYKPRKIIISWLIDPLKCHQFNYFAYKGINRSTGTDVIGLEHIPTSFDDAYMVAHEMGHAIRKSDGLQLPIAMKYHTQEIEDLASRLGSMFDDPLIDSFLQNIYNFNPAYHYIEVVIPSASIMLNQSFTEPERDINRIMEIFFHSSQLLQWDSIKDVKKHYKNGANIETFIE
jgi:hypothetical protein